MDAKLSLVFVYFILMSLGYNPVSSFRTKKHFERSRILDYTFSFPYEVIFILVFYSRNLLFLIEGKGWNRVGGHSKAKCGPHPSKWYELKANLFSHFASQILCDFSFIAAQCLSDKKEIQKITENAVCKPRPYVVQLDIPAGFQTVYFDK